MRLFKYDARSLMVLACAAVTGCSASASDTAKVAERSEHTAHARSGLVGQIIACESKWNEAGAVNDSRATSACRLSIDGTVVACRPDHYGRCTLAMPNGSDVATAQVDFAFDPNDASYPAGETCEQDLGTLVRDGGLLRFTSVSTCAANANLLPSATQTTFACSAQWNMLGKQDLLNAAGNPAADFKSGDSMGSCDVIANGNPASCALPPNAFLAISSCDLPWQAPTMLELAVQPMPGTDAFGRATQATSCHQPTATLVEESSGALSAVLEEACETSMGLSIRINGSLASQVHALPGSFPVVDWTADAAAGDCVLEAFNPGSHQVRYPALTSFVSGAGSSGQAIATFPMGPIWANHGAPDAKFIALTCTDGDGNIAQKISRVYARNW